MKSVPVIAMLLAASFLASCANTARGAATDAKQTGMALQDGTNSVLKAGSTKKY